MSFETDLIAQVKSDLEGAQISGTDIFNEVVADVDELPDDVFYTMPVAIITMGDGTPDEEEPSLGELRLYVDVYTRAYAAASEQELADADGLEAIKSWIRENYSYKAGDDYGSVLQLTDYGANVPLTPKNNKGQGRKAIWTRRFTWRVVIG